MVNIAIFASGEGTNAENLFRYYEGNTNVKIKLVIAGSDTAGVIKRAEKYRKTVQIVSRKALQDYTDQLIDFLKTEKVDLIVLAGFLQKIPEKMVKAFPERIVNIHPALLPKFGGKGMYGMHVHTAVIAAKESESGITVHFVNEHYDEGEHILQARCPVLPEDSPETLAARVHQLEYQFLPIAIDKVIAEIESGKI